MQTLRTALLAVLIAAASLTAAARQQPGVVSAPGATARVVSAANAFLATLGPAERREVSFAFDGPQRTGWSNLPEGIFNRKGLRLGDLSGAQRAAALAVVAAALSPEGYHKVTEIMNGDEVLRKEGGGRTGGRQGRGGIRFGLDEYYIAFLGTPSTSTPWLLQFGGHHLAINVTIVGSESVMTPSLPAAQPARYVMNGETIRPLGQENDKAFALVNALDAAERRQAILNYRVDDLVLGPGEDGRTIMPEGLRASAMTPAQQRMLLDLAHEWVGILNRPAADAKMAEITANLAQTWFSWSGPTTNGSVAYFRIQGPTVVIEYAPQQGDVMHVHTIYRDPTNDYGAKLVRRR
ncbi:MAG TPA: DUF3500 domain-containing protein [Vicinamibacterales bacterium]|nr:DUF3500 domain-containing protein [Vicinamibacterales bacterium]